MYFLENSHQYFIQDKEYKSFSYLKKLVEPDKDWDEIARKYAEKNKLSVEEVKAMWEKKKNDSCERGTLLHLHKETGATQDSSIVTHQSPTEGDKKIIRNLETLEDGWHLELPLYNHEFEACGTADRVFIETIKGIRYASLYDFKGLSLDTPIFTTTGWKTMGDIKVGNFVFDGEGNPTEVEHISSIHHNPCYKLTFDSGEEIICDHEHKWELTHTVMKTKTYKEGTKRKSKKSYTFENSVFTSEEIYNNFEKFIRFNRPRVKCTPVFLKKKDLPIDPYVLGLWLGDGNRCAPTITCVNNLIWKEIERRGYKTSINHNRNFEKAESRTIYNLGKQLKELNLIKNKHIPEVYKLASYEQRLDLLRGFMDADGYFNRTRNRCVATTTKKWQALEISELSSSLGVKPTIIKAKCKGFGKSNISKFDVCFTPKVNPFLVRNKDYNTVLNEKKVNMERGKYRIIKKIEKVDTVPTICIAVKSPCHTYLVTKSFIKTHNTNSSIDLESYFNPRTKTHEMMKAPLNHLMNSNYWGYALQLSTYAYFLERYNYVIKDLELNHVPLVECNTKKEKDSAIIQHDGKYYKTGTETNYNIPYLKKESIKLLNYYKLLKTKNKLPKK